MEREAVGITVLLGGVCASGRVEGDEDYRPILIILSLTGDIKLAQEQLRHTHMSTTSDTYVHVERKVSDRASEALAKAIAPVVS